MMLPIYFALINVLSANIIVQESNDLASIVKNLLGILKKQEKDIEDVKRTNNILFTKVTALENEIDRIKKVCCSKPKPKPKPTPGPKPKPTGKSKTSPAPSCKWLTENYHNLKSGLYWLALKSPTQVFCDLDEINDGGGWLKVGRAHYAVDRDHKEEYKKSLSDDLLKLNTVQRNNFLLTGEGLRELQSIIHFTQIRLYCYKPSVGSTVHIFTRDDSLGRSVVNFLTGISDSRPRSCGSYQRFSDDDSEIAKSCHDWDQEKWDGGILRNDRMHRPMFIGYEYHFDVADFCDDCYPGSTPIGTWEFYVR